MSKRIVVILIILLFGVLGCVGGTSAPSRAVDGMVERGPNVQNVQIVQGQVLPPYGKKVQAQVAVLELRVSTSEKDTAEKLEDMTEAIEHMALLASEHGSVSLEEVSVHQVGGGYAREDVSTSNVWNLDTSAITLRLATDLAENEHDLMESVVAFNDFMNAIDLPDTITVQPISVEAAIGDVAEYRSQLIDRVYRDLDLAQAEYGQSIKFEVTGLYDPLKMMRLSDTEYYIYLEPVVSVREF